MPGVQDIIVDHRTFDVLILDDIAPLRFAISSLLQDAGLSTREAATSREAFDVLARGRCHVLLTDVLLGQDSPIVDGRMVAALARQAFPTLGVIYASGLPIDLGRPPTRRERLLPKPFRTEQLVATIQDLLLDVACERLAA